MTDAKQWLDIDDQIPECDYCIGGEWGCHIAWLKPEVFLSPDMNEDTLISVWGHYTPRPKVGQTLWAEFKRSFRTFVFMDVTYCNDPPDMFFAKVKTTGYWEKPDNDSQAGGNSR